MPMTDNGDVCFIPAGELVRLYRARKASPLEVMQTVLARIDALNPAVNAYVTIARESALTAARRATRALGRKGTALPPLHGVPVSIKDLTSTKGIRTTWGSLIYKDHVPVEDDLVVQRLKAAGAIVVGKTNTPEFGAGGNTFNAVFGATRNPWNPALSCGGSSGGAAVAVATGMGPIAQGSDLGGSLRTPAAFCGVLGFRTTPGLVPTHPRTLVWDTLGVTGPMARTVADVALMLSTMAGPDDRAPLSYEVDTSQFTRAVKAPSIKGWRVAWTPDLDGLIPVDEEVRRIAHDAIRVFRGLGARVDGRRTLFHRFVYSTLPPNEQRPPCSQGQASLSWPTSGRPPLAARRSACLTTSSPLISAATSPWSGATWCWTWVPATAATRSRCAPGRSGSSRSMSTRWSCSARASFSAPAPTICRSGRTRGRNVRARRPVRDRGGRSRRRPVRWPSTRSSRATPIV